jgi:hypothetical protein
MLAPLLAKARMLASGMRVPMLAEALIPMRSRGGDDATGVGRPRG